MPDTHPATRAAARRAPRRDTPCDLVTVPVRQGLEAADILRLRAGVGPVLCEGGGEALGFLVPPGTAAHWDVPGSKCTQTYGAVRAAAQGGCQEGSWLVPPEGAYEAATDAARLRAALGEAARTIAALDRCREGLPG